MFVNQSNAKNIHPKNLDAVALFYFDWWRTFCVIFFIMAYILLNIVGKTFNGVECVRFIEFRKPTGKLSAKNSYFEFKCTCGDLFVSRGSWVKNGSVKGCSKCKRNNFINRMTTHSLCKSPEYRAWGKMKERCLNPTNKNYYIYKDRPICKEWISSFEAFYRDMGKRPSANHSLDRIDNNKGYYKENCRWATQGQQTMNTRRNKWFEYDGLRMIQSDWARYFGAIDANNSHLIRKYGFEYTYQFYFKKNNGKLPVDSFDKKILKRYE